MNDEEIMKKFNETFANQGNNIGSNASQPVTPYKASSNLNNNDIQNQNANVQSIQQGPKLDVKDLLSTDNNTYYSTSDTTINQSNVQSSEPPKYQNNVNYNYVPTYNTNNRKKPTVKLTGENMIFIVIVVILFAFILVIPTIYDFIRQIKMR